MMFVPSPRLISLGLDHGGPSSIQTRKSLQILLRRYAEVAINGPRLINDPMD
ncbi:MAG: hypothetical protein P8M50_00805 [Paracoccaceae bacterium]|nr:hypothetical protein [Paracoccaceae bacterium]